MTTYPATTNTECTSSSSSHSSGQTVSLRYLTLHSWTAVQMILSAPTHHQSKTRHSWRWVHDNQRQGSDMHQRYNQPSLMVGMQTSSICTHFEIGIAMNASHTCNSCLYSVASRNCLPGSQIQGWCSTQKSSNIPHYQVG